MQNAHERFGTLEFIKRTKDTTTRVRVHVDRAVLEPAKDDRGCVVPYSTPQWYSCDEACLSRATSGSRGISHVSHKDSRPACLERSRGERAQRVEGSLLTAPIPSLLRSRL